MIIICLMFIFPMKLYFRRDYGQFCLEKAVIIIMVGVVMKANLAGIPLVVTAEPRPAILALLIATFWEIVHSEWMMHVHLKRYHDVEYKQQSLNKNKVPNENCNAITNDVENEAESHNSSEKSKGQEKSSFILSYLRFESIEGKDKECKNVVGLYTFAIILQTIVVGTFLSGSVMELIRFRTLVNGGDTIGCVKSYNLYTLATAIVTDSFLDGNSAKVGTWILYLSYIFLVVVCPIFVMEVQLFAFLFRTQNKLICRLADNTWSFACVEILLLALILVQVSLL
jgi:hypothetical protein